MQSSEFTQFYTGFCLAAILATVSVVYLAKRLERTNADRLVLIVWNAVLTIYLSFILLFSIESYLRFWVDRTDSFAMTKLSMRWLDRHYHKNNFGARDNLDYKLKPQNGKGRITFVGDSFTAGHGIQNVDERFSNLLRAKLSETEIHIMAANGLESIDELRLLENLVAQGYELDVVCLGYCLNDISYLVPQTETLYSKVDEFNKELGWLAKESYLWNEIQFRLFARNNPEIGDYYNYVLNAYQEKPLKQQKQVLSRIADIIRANGGELVVMTFPFLQRSDTPNNDYMARTQLDYFWKSIGIKHLDLSEALAVEEADKLRVNRYDAHPNELANQLVADTLYGWIRTHQLVERQ